jgi:hypothetical protein
MNKSQKGEFHEKQKTTLDYRRYLADHHYLWPDDLVGRWDGGDD